MKTDADVYATFLQSMQGPGKQVASNTPAPSLTGAGGLPSAFPVTPFDCAAIASAAQALADYAEARFGRRHAVSVDRRLASFWYATSLRPQGWQLPDVRDHITGDYRTRDGWIRIHANAPHHRDAALSVLGCGPEHDSVAAAILHWDAQPLEDAMVAAHACAAVMHSRDDWLKHPQGQAVSAEPVFHHARHDLPDAYASSGGCPDARPGAHPARMHDALATRERPLAGLRVLDMTRVLAGPVSTRFLAGYGATVLRLDPPWWTEPGMVPEVTLGKRCAEIDLRDGPQIELLRTLLADADIFVHGYRSDALARLGLGEDERQAIRPGLVDVCLDAYGWTGPWRTRRGFDSLVQMSNGIALAGMQHYGTDKPTPLPVQALDQTAGYLMAASALRGLTSRLGNGLGSATRLSLARVGELLASGAAVDTEPLAPETQDDLSPELEKTEWGPARRLHPPCEVEGIPMRWDLPAGSLRSSTPSWP
jgi:crotonobetainyl-CoA:carnitine CoA-transferase CaiB-like acyl-CoA transferase